MTRKLRCRACRAVYFDRSTGGVVYFHQCALVPNPAFQPDPGRPRYDPRELIERPGHRDENLLEELPLDAEGRMRPRLVSRRLEGAGAEELPDVEG